MIFFKCERNGYSCFRSSVSGSFFYLHDRENQAGELELFSNFGRSVDNVFEAWHLVLFIFLCDQSRQ